MKRALFSTEPGLNEAVLGILKRGLDKGCFDTLLVATRTPARDSYTYILAREPELLDRATVLAPVMGVQGAKALSSLTARGSGKVAAVMRPCEARAAVELSKLHQVDLENVTLVTIDCPGTLPLDGYLGDPEKGEKVFAEAAGAWNDEAMRPTCRICVDFAGSASDLHVATLGMKDGKALLIGRSPDGERVLDALGMTGEQDADGWQQEVDRRTSDRKTARARSMEEMGSTASGLTNLLAVLGRCIGCHNCRSACPICYCRHCYFDSEALDATAREYLERARAKGALGVESDTLLFYLGRMSHVTLSCVSCGACEEACPMDIPVAQLFAFVASETQALFGYTPGADREEPPPLATFVEHELTDFEDERCGEQEQAAAASARTEK